LYSSPSIIRMNKSRRMSWVEHVARMGRLLLGKSKGKRQLGRPRCRRVDNVKDGSWRDNGVVWTDWSGSR
jgi:hypothetical protein